VSGEVCIPNIGPGGRKQRNGFGLIALAVSVVAGAALIYTGAARPWRLGLVLPLWVAGLGYFQAREKT
jgi:hypothetical protein